jgi:hypothetical protein
VHRQAIIKQSERIKNAIDAQHGRSLKLLRQKPIAIALFLVLLAALTAGCSDGTKAKEQMQQALTKQKEMQNYRFTGNAEINQDGFRAEWTGTASNDPLKMEADVTIMPKEGADKLEIPILLQDNKLYLHIPALNKDDEFLLVDLSSSSASGGTPAPLLAENIKNSGEMSRTIFNMLISDLDKEWFEHKETSTQPDGKTVNQYTVAINEKNEQEINARWSAKLPALIDALNQYGLITKDRAERLKQDWTDKTLRMTAPGTLALMVGENGFITEQQIDLRFSIKKADGDAKPYQIKLDSSFADINENPSFNKEVPTQVKPFEQIIQLLLN